MRHPPDTGSHPHGIDVARIAASQRQEKPSGVVLRRPKRSAARFRKGVVVGSGNPLGKERSRKWNFLVTCITEVPMKTSRFTDSQIIAMLKEAAGAAQHGSPPRGLRIDHSRYAGPGRRSSAVLRGEIREADRRRGVASIPGHLHLLRIPDKQRDALPQVAVNGRLFSGRVNGHVRSIQPRQWQSYFTKPLHRQFLERFERCARPPWLRAERPFEIPIPHALSTGLHRHPDL